MALRKWLTGLFGRGPEIVGRSKGGSRLLRYAGAEFSGPRFGFPDQPTDDLAKARESVYEDLFGPIDLVSHELIPLVPHIDVYQFPPIERRPYFTLVTGGMSDLPMNSPAELGAACRRVELVFYASEAKPEYLELLRRLGHFPHDNHTWLHWDHSMPNGTPPERIFGSTSLDSFFFMPSVLVADSSLGEKLVWHGEPVNLVWCVPISSAECEHKLEYGAASLYDLFQARQHPLVFNEDRESYV